uniref:Uncharacterized protein n=1 Tax=Glossina austeni TaxID=7395 RepID=A0A1A9UIB3_GLOAU
MELALGTKLRPEEESTLKDPFKAKAGSLDNMRTCKITKIEIIGLGQYTSATLLLTGTPACAGLTYMMTQQLMLCFWKLLALSNLAEFSLVPYEKITEHFQKRRPLALTVHTGVLCLYLRFFFICEPAVEMFVDTNGSANDDLTSMVRQSGSGFSLLTVNPNKQRRSLAAPTLSFGTAVGTLGTVSCNVSEFQLSEASSGLVFARKRIRGRETNDCRLCSSFRLSALLLKHFWWYPEEHSFGFPGSQVSNCILDYILNARTFSLYVEKCEENNQSFVKGWIYTKVFNTGFNLSFHTPQKISYLKCDLLKEKIEAGNNVEEKLRLRKSHDLHLQNGERDRNCLVED